MSLETSLKPKSNTPFNEFSNATAIRDYIVQCGRINADLLSNLLFSAFEAIKSQQSVVTSRKVKE